MNYNFDKWLSNGLVVNKHRTQIESKDRKYVYDIANMTFKTLIVTPDIDLLTNVLEMSKFVNDVAHALKHIQVHFKDEVTNIANSVDYSCSFSWTHEYVVSESECYRIIVFNNREYTITQLSSTTNKPGTLAFKQAHKFLTALESNGFKARL